ncbi:MAG TPA: plasmid pRiA4b ORF-3 family protein [Edaphobacter sp.]
MTVYRLYVFLLDVAPPIWRRIELSSETSLAQLHKVLQAALGWQDSHLHEFEIGGQRYGVPDTDYDQPGEVVKASTVKLSRALPRKGSSLLYSYDFGDNWAHSVVLEDIVPKEPDTKYPRVVDGARACPPEDSGGPYGYAELVEILAKPRHKEYRQMREWAGKNFAPEKFSVRDANLRLKQILPKSPKLKTDQVQ